MTNKKEIKELIVKAIEKYAENEGWMGDIFLEEIFLYPEGPSARPDIVLNVSHREDDYIQRYTITVTAHG